MPRNEGRQVATHDDEQTRTVCIPRKDREGPCPSLIAFCLLENRFMDFRRLRPVGLNIPQLVTRSTSLSEFFCEQNVSVAKATAHRSSVLPPKPRALRKSVWDSGSMTAASGRSENEPTLWAFTGVVTLRGAGAG